jgi:hypothetical protein
MRKIDGIRVVTAVVLVASAAIAWAAITPYSQDFEGLALPSPGGLLGDGWLVFGNVFDDSGVYQYGYGPDPAPNNSDAPAFCLIATGQGGAAQGAQQLVVFSDYNNGDHGNADWVIETVVFQEQTIEAGDVGALVDFTFDAKMGDLTGASEAAAFIKTLDPAAGYATTNFVTTDMTSIPTTWGTYSVQLSIDAGLVDQILQFGFLTRASNYEASGVYYDNVNQPVPVDLMSFSVE